MKKYHVILDLKEMEKCLSIARSGKHFSRQVIHALILLNCNEGKYSTRVKNEELARILQIGQRTIDRIKKRFVEEGLEAALNNKPAKKDYRKKTMEEVEAQLIVLSSSKPPDGFSKWSLRLLADKMIELGYVESISYETVRQVLKKNDLK